MASKKKKVAKTANTGEAGAVVPVVFQTNTSYGSSGSYGYIPASFAQAWIDKGLVLSAVQYVKDNVEEAEDEVVAEGEPERVEPDGDSPIFGEDGESDSEQSGGELSEG